MRRLLGLLAAVATVALATASANAVAPSPSFRAECLFSHRAMDDPIVHPGMPGASHRHDFYGNRSTDASSTFSSLRRGRTSCEPDVDLAGYWVPTLYDTRGRPLTATTATFYYVASTHPLRRIRPYPAGLVMLAGDAMARRPAKHPAGRWGCEDGPAARSPVIRRCPRGSRLQLDLRFPDCWNGRDRDSADHRRHMAYSVDGRCPRSHPVPVPELRFVIPYPTRGLRSMRIASGKSFTVHGDFFNAWDRGALRRRVVRCLRRGIVCDANGLRESP